jgi:dipeptidyl aminopeptidase/acylaminoacyl peptidase
MFKLRFHWIGPHKFWINTLAIVSVLLLLAACDLGAPQTPASGSPAGVGDKQVPVPISTAPVSAPETPDPQAPPPPTVTPAPPLPTSLPRPAPPEGKATTDKSSLQPNIVWASEAEDNLTLWSGKYGTSPSPSISGVHSIVRWDTPDGPLKVVGMSVSPDRKSLAVLLGNALVRGEGDISRWLYVIDLQSRAIQAVPDYATQYSSYEYQQQRPPTKILGWLDNDKFAVQQDGEYAAAIASKDGSFYARVPFPPQYSDAVETALSPDGKTLLSVVVGPESGLWLYQPDASNPRRIVEGSQMRPIYSPVWSPDGQRVAFLSPKLFMKDGAQWQNNRAFGIWFLEVASASQVAKTGRPGIGQEALDSDDVWDVAPTWSPDGARIAFLRAERRITSDATSHARPEEVSTNIFIADTSNFAPRKLTNFPDARNSGLEWSAEGDLVLSSSDVAAGGISRLVSVSTKNGRVTELLVSASGERYQHPLFIK